MRTLTFVCALCAAIAATADNATPRKGRPRGLIKASGGIVEKAYKGKTVRVVCALDKARGTQLDAIALKIRRSAQLPIESVRGDVPQGVSPMAYAREVSKADNVGAVVLVVEDGALPILLSSADEKWTILNVAGFRADGDKFAGRLSKALWGAVARALGAGSTGDAGCVLVPFSDVGQLDAIRASEPSPVAHNALIDVARMSGINIIYFATYRTACQQGWAPQPANDEQKKIWNEVHAIPDRPITIEFDPKKDE